MSKRYKRPPIEFEDFKAKKNEEGAIPIRMGDGTVFSVPPPELWPDDALKSRAGEDIDPVGMAEALLGVDRYAAFVALGGSAAALSAIVQEYSGLTVGESSASSGSSESTAEPSRPTFSGTASTSPETSGPDVSPGDA